MNLAGPIEFSTGDAIVILLVVSLMALALPLLVGLIAYLVYRSKTPVEERGRRAGIRVFALWTALGFLGQVAVGFLIGVVAEITQSNI